MLRNIVKLRRKAYFISQVIVDLSRDTDNPRTIAVDFCQKHRLNKLAVNIVQAKIIEAK